jgi:predicted RecB family nuclease
MSSPLIVPPDLDHTRTERSRRLLSGEIIESSFYCKLKAYLKLDGQSGTKSDYESLTTQLREELRQQTTAALMSRYRDGENLSGSVLTHPAPGTGAPVILDAVVENEEFSLRFDGLKRVDDPSRPSNPHYIPILVFEGEKVREEHRRLLEVYALVLGKVQGAEPRSGVIIHGRECRSTKVQFKAGLVRASRTLEEVARLAGTDPPPPLILNDHCQVCEFRQRCLEQAKSQDNISLIRGLSERVIKKYKKKGITTVTRLSCTFRPRKENKREVKNRRPHSFGLQALAVRDGKIYVYGTPELPTNNVRIYVDFEGDPGRNFVYLIGVLIDNGREDERYSFWADDEAGQGRIFEEFLDLLCRFQDFALFTYGRYESVFLKRMRSRFDNKRLIDRALSRSVNLLRAIYGKVYFPADSNGLKAVAPVLGFSWTENDASGVQSLVWRYRWERGDGEAFKDKLLTYNIEDCLALKRVTEVVYGIAQAYGERSEERSGEQELGINWAKARRLSQISGSGPE